MDITYVISLLNHLLHMNSLKLFIIKNDKKELEAIFIFVLNFCWLIIFHVNSVFF